MTASISIDSDNTAIEQCLVERFEKIAEWHPQQLAVKHRDRALSYETLNAAANRIAYCLLHTNGSKINAAALLFEQGIDIISAVFGTLKAGARYCALDAQAPEERIEYILSDFQTDLILTNSLNFDVALRVGRRTRTIVINLDEIALENNSVNPGIVIAPDQIAAVVYTSGSTGRPRGIVRTHQLTTASVVAWGTFRQLCGDDRISLTHPVSYGSGDADLLMGLLNGAAVFPFSVRAEGIHNLAEWLKRERITIFHSSPSEFRELSGLAFPVDHFSDLRLIRLSGAPITQKDFALYRTRFSARTRLEVGMGSTEAGAICNAVIGQDFSFPKNGSPAGYAREGKKILILDKNGQVLPPGKVGEIAVKSRDFSLGYWQQPDLSERKYLHDSEDAEDITYLTGDLGTVLSDGFVIHLGRKDLTVKIRAYRVDISEVEHALLEHPNIKEAGVRAWDRDEGEKYLVAYIVPRSECVLNASEVRLFLSKKLPHYMIPAAFKFLDSLPLTNGKLDRLALPKPDPRRPHLKEPYVGPRNEVERKLAGIWSDILRIDEIGIHDNFFDLGGHSLTANQVITGVIEAFQLTLPVKTFLESPTVAEMAEWVCQRQSNGATEPRRTDFMSESTPTKTNLQEVPSIGFPREDLEQSIPDRFEKMVREYPYYPAVESGDEILTYAELNARSNRLARAIAKRAERNVHPVALLFGKGRAQIIAMLAVLKAGKFFVLLDPSFSVKRVVAILNDTGSELLLHDQETAALANQVTPRECQLLQAELMGDDDATENLGYRIAPNELAYVVYTSGSTGKPKGVIQNHQNILHRTMLRVRRDHISANDRLAHVSSGTSNEITNAFYTLLTGASMVIFDLRKRGVDRLAQWLIQQRITVCSLATPLFRKVCENLSGTEQFHYLRLIGLGGDTIFKSDVELFEKCFPPDCVLVTALSSAETGALTATVIPKACEISGSEAPIGHPEPDKELYLVDESGGRVGFNQVGEIVVRSKYVSPGYWNRPELNEEKFKVDPEDPEQRIYYTGDLALMLPDGCLVHKGRKDFRVKIRGYAVEIAEVETALRGHEAVNDCLVVERKDQSGETKLVAYYVGNSQCDPNVSELRHYLMSSLPDYMVPSAFQPLNAIPLTPNGKVDRKGLPEPDTARPELSVSYEAPRTPVEKRIAEFWAKTLSVDRVGRHDNFFDLGGHSLSGSLVVSWIHEAFGIYLPVGEFFANPTVARLADRIEGYSREEHKTIKKQWTYLCELQKGKDHAPVFFFPGGGGGEPEFFVYGLLARHVGTEYPFYGLRARGADGVLQPHASVVQMADAYVEEIRSIQPKGPYYLVGECCGGVNAYEAACQLIAHGQEVAMLVLMDVERPTTIKYFQYRVRKWLNAMEEYLDATVLKWCRESYYLQRLPHHLRQIASLPLRDYPGYLAGRLAHSLKPPQKRALTVASRHEREEIVLFTMASGDALKHIERVRENYRRKVRRFRPQPYSGNIELIVSEKLYRRGATLGWHTLVPERLKVHAAPGNHWTYIREHVAQTGLKLRECLEQANKRTTSTNG